MLTLFVILTVGIYSFIMYRVLHNVTNPKRNQKQQLEQYNNPIHVTR